MVAWICFEQHSTAGTRLGNTRRTKPIVRHSSPRQLFKANDLSFAHGFDRIVRPYRFRSPKTVSFALIVRLNRSYRVKIWLNSEVPTVVKASKSYPWTTENEPSLSQNRNSFIQTLPAWVSNKEKTWKHVSERDGTLSVHVQLEWTYDSMCLCLNRCFLLPQKVCKKYVK